MGTQYFACEDDMDDSFEDAMRQEEDKERLRLEILELEDDLASVKDQLREKELELSELQEA